MCNQVHNAPCSPARTLSIRHHMHAQQLAHDQARHFTSETRSGHVLTAVASISFVSSGRISVSQSPSGFVPPTIVLPPSGWGMRNAQVFLLCRVAACGMYSSQAQFGHAWHLFSGLYQTSYWSNWPPGGTHRTAGLSLLRRPKASDNLVSRLWRRLSPRRIKLVKSERQ